MESDVVGESLIRSNEAVMSLLLCAGARRGRSLLLTHSSALFSCRVSFSFFSQAQSKGLAAPWKNQMLRNWRAARHVKNLECLTNVFSFSGLENRTAQTDEQREDQQCLSKDQPRETVSLTFGYLKPNPESFSQLSIIFFQLETAEDDDDGRW